MLGNGRLEALCFDGEKRLAHIRGKMRKKVRPIMPVSLPLALTSKLVRSGSTRVISFCCLCVISRMTRPMSSSSTPLMRPVAVRFLCSEFPFRMLNARYVLTVKAYGELPENAKINETDTFGEEEGECTFEFGDDEEVDIDDI